MSLRVKRHLSGQRAHVHLSLMLAAGLLGALVAPLPMSTQLGVSEAAAQVSPAEVYKPTPLPDRIVLTWCADPSTSMAVTWRTSTDVTKALAEIAPAEEGPRFFQLNNGREHKLIRIVNGLRRFEAQTTPFKLNDLQCHMHVVRFADLAPETAYAYRVGDGVNWSEWFQFRTASREAKPFCFLYFGDSQDDIRSMWSYVFRAAYLAVPQAAFTLHGGDLTATREYDPEWGEWFHAGGWVNAMVPVIATPGNHEYVKASADRSRPAYLEPHWRAQFTFPENGPQGVEETAYYIDYQGARIISLDSSIRLAEQAEWLERILSDNRCTWTIATFHHPMYSIANDRRSAVRDVWKMVFDKHQVDLVLTGHDHAYCRSGLIGPGGAETTSTNQSGGTVYVVSVSGPKMNRLGPAEGEPLPAQFGKRLAEDMQLYQVISIDGRTLRYETRTATGSLYDAFTLKKRPDGTNEIVEQVPNVPEHRRVGPDLDYTSVAKD